MREGCGPACFASFLIGASLGAAAALLMAPESGERTRRRIRRAAEDAQDYLDDVGGRIGEKADETMRTIEKKTRTMMG
jgi:gas vesicle protein